MSAVADLQGLSDLSQCAYALGMAFGCEAQAAADDDRRLRLHELFERCFHGYRVAVALKLRLRRAAPPAWRERGASEAEDLRDRDPPDREFPEREAPGRDRIDYDRDREAASLPILLKTLGGVAQAAEALPEPRPAELPTLRELLARMTGEAARPPPPAASASRSAVAVLARPMTTPSSARARLLLGSASSGLARRATGPPGG